ncbi:MAG: thiamine phosphate synthase [Clostridia bacterium]|nr:thiamine phosphate synthase [Clostridia bacterium]
MKNKNRVDYKLYLVTDRNLLDNISLEQAVEQAISGGATLVQLREKDISTMEFYHVAIRIKQVTDKYGVPLIINDRLDIALAVDAAGLHVGQSDLPVSIARSLLGQDKILGVSATTLSEALKAQKEGADYIGAGAVFATGTKKDAGYVSKNELKNICRKLDIPVVAIGGINEYNIVELDGSGIQGVAVVSAIMGKQDIKKAAQHIKDKLIFIE